MEEVIKFLEEVNETNSQTEKLDILKKYKDNKVLHKVFRFALSNQHIFHVRPSTLKKNADLRTEQYATVDMFQLLADLESRKITGHDAMGAVNSWTEAHPEFKDLLYRILDKNLKIRMSETLINKIIPNCVPTWNVALASKYEDGMDIDFTDEWYASRKLDGVRCLIFIDENRVVSSYSRQGKRFETLGKLEKLIASKFPAVNVVLDGEVCLMGDNGLEDFQGVMKEIRRKDHTIENPKFWVFDMITFDEFYNQEGTRPLASRYMSLSANFEGSELSTDMIDILPQEKVTSHDDIIKLSQEAVQNKWEGVMVRRNCGYEGKRSKNLLKVKMFHDDEYVVTGMETEVHRVISKETGLEVKEKMLSAVFIEHKGYKVRVGSGFSQDQRRAFYNNPDLIVGKVITVQYFEETQNQSGEISLRFPVFKVLHGDKRAV